MGLTDAEIVKALECCIGDTEGKECVSCPLYAIDECQDELNLVALDLINRLQADVDNYKQIAENQQKIILDKAFENKKLKAEIGRLKGIVNIVPNATVEMLEEFAEQVKMAFYYEFDELIPSIMADKIDNLLKELVGEDNG